VPLPVKCHDPFQKQLHLWPRNAWWLLQVLATTLGIPLAAKDMQSLSFAALGSGQGSAANPWPWFSPLSLCSDALPVSAWTYVPPTWMLELISASDSAATVDEL